MQGNGTPATATKLVQEVEESVEQHGAAAPVPINPDTTLGTLEMTGDIQRHRGFKNIWVNGLGTRSTTLHLGPS